MKEKLIIVVITVALQVAIFSAGYYRGKFSCVTSEANTIIKEVKHEAQSFANKPKSDDDVTERLCEWAKKRAKDEGRAFKSIPNNPCH